MDIEKGELSPGLSDAWHWFLLLNASRTSNGFGMNPITYQEMLAFFELNRIVPEPWEVNLIKKFDEIALSELKEKSKEQPENSFKNKNKKRN